MKETLSHSMVDQSMLFCRLISVPGPVWKGQIPVELWSCSSTGYHFFPYHKKETREVHVTVFLSSLSHVPEIRK